MDTKRLSILIFSMIMYFTFPLNVRSNPTPIEVQVSIIDPTSQHGENPKSPILIPTISLEDHTLYFETPCDGCTLNIVDSNDVVVYTLVIPTGATSLVLPSTLSGEFTIEIIRGNYLFYGTIDLP